jgi:hypothetical protein
MSKELIIEELKKLVGNYITKINAYLINIRRVNSDFSGNHTKLVLLPKGNRAIVIEQSNAFQFFGADEEWILNSKSKDEASYDNITTYYNIADRIEEANNKLTNKVIADIQDFQIKPKFGFGNGLCKISFVDGTSYYVCVNGPKDLSVIQAYSPYKSMSDLIDSYQIQYQKYGVIPKPTICTIDNMVLVEAFDGNLFEIDMSNMTDKEIIACKQDPARVINAIHEFKSYDI